MKQFNPCHPGEWIHDTYLEPFGISATEIAEALEVNPSTFWRVISGNSRISSDMAIRLHRVLGPSPEFWLKMQSDYDLWIAESNDKHENLERFEFPAA